MANALYEKGKMAFMSGPLAIEGSFNDRVIEALCALLDGQAHADRCSIEYGNLHGPNSIRFMFDVSWHEDIGRETPRMSRHELFERVSAKLAEQAAKEKR